MSTAPLYAQPTDGPDWTVPMSGTTQFTWEYDEPRARLLSLYQKGKDKQWDAQKRIDWDIEVDPYDASAGIPLQQVARPLRRSILPGPLGDDDVALSNQQSGRAAQRLARGFGYGPHGGLATQNVDGTTGESDRQGVAVRRKGGDWGIELPNDLRLVRRIEGQDAGPGRDEDAAARRHDHVGLGDFGHQPGLFQQVVGTKGAVEHRHGYAGLATPEEGGEGLAIEQAHGRLPQ